MFECWYAGLALASSCLAMPAVEIIVCDGVFATSLALASISVNPELSCWLCPNCRLVIPSTFASLPTIASIPLASVSVAAFCADMISICFLMPVSALVSMPQTRIVLFPVPGGPVLGSKCDLSARWAAL